MATQGTTIGSRLALTAVAGIAGALGCGPQPQAAAPALQVADPASSPPFGSDPGYATDDPKERADDPAQRPTARVAARSKDCCKGLNECKGKGNCKVKGSQDCKGKNECKGKGGCKAADCASGPARSRRRMAASRRKASPWDAASSTWRSSRGPRPRV